MWNLLLVVKDLRDDPSVKPAACQLSTRHALRVPFQGNLNVKKPPLKGEGDQRSWWRGSCGIFCLMCEVSRKYPSVTCGDSSAQGTPCGCPKGEPECKRASPLGVTPHGVGRCPQGRGDRSVRGEPPIGGGGVLVESFACCARFYGRYPSVSLRLPAQHKARPSCAFSREPFMA